MRSLIGGVLAVAAGAGCVVGEEWDPAAESTTMSEVQKASRLANNVPFRNASGYSTTYSTRGYIDLNNEFFKNLGTNGRRCVSCHLPSSGWAITPADMQATFESSQGGVIDDDLGLGAVFRLNDGANTPTADVSTLEKRRSAYSLLLTKGLIRVGMPIPAGAEFELVNVSNPSNFNTGSTAAEISFYRRPLPAANLRALSTVMWDGRLTFPNQSIHFDLTMQATAATEGHAEGSPLTAAQRESLVVFQTELHNTQAWDDSAKDLRSESGDGGAAELIEQEFYIGINDNFGDMQTNAPFTPIVFDLYDAWSSSSNSARRAVERGQALFNTRAFTIAGVSGLNGESIRGNAPLPASFTGTCTTCHDAPNFGNHSISAPLNIGVAAASRRTPDLPLYTFRKIGTTETISVTDAGRAMVTGKWKDIGRFKGPILRGLAARAPYFHNGSAQDLAAAVQFYNVRFNMNLTSQEKLDLVAFLRTL